MIVAQLTTDKREHFRAYADFMPSFGTAPEALLQGFAATPEVQFHVLSCVQEMVSSPHQLASNIFYHAVHVPKLGWMRTGYQGCVRAVRRKLRELRPDIVHGQGTERDCALSAVFSGFPNVLTIHGNMRLVAQVNRARPFSYQWLAARLERLTLPRTDGVVCITSYTRDAVASLVPRTWVLPNAVDETFFPVEPQPAPEFTILCVGAICFRKNQNDFIRALDPVAKRHAFRLVFLGSGDAADPYLAEFKQLVASRPWCAHEGFAGRAELKERLRRAAVLALPTREDNCPMTVLEAMAASVPVVASRVGGVPDLIDGRTTGLFCDPERPESMAAAIEQLLGDEALRRRLREAAKADAVKRFHPAAVARRHVEIYREVLGARA